jgi:hypothetical protein
MDRITFHRRVLGTLKDAGVPALIGGSHALAFHAGVTRPRRDLDLMIRHEHWPWAEHVLQAADIDCRMVFPHWLGKARSGEIVVDLIFNSGNGVARVDDEWFAHARLARMFGVDVEVTPPEELLWSKAFVMERERFDGGDVLHLIAATAPTLDWERVLRRFREHEPVLLAHLVLYKYVYPGRAGTLPEWLLSEVQHRADRADARSSPRLCRGPLLSRAQYLTDLVDGDLIDARRRPHGAMSDDEIECWTRAIEDDVQDTPGDARAGAGARVVKTGLVSRR